MLKKVYDIIILSMVTLLFACDSAENKHDSRAQIRDAYKAWCVTKVREGEFLASDSCNPAYFYNNNDVESAFGMGVPSDTAEVKFFYCDINKDNKEDAVVTFFVDQCDGGNALMFVQYKLVLLSSNEKYIINDSLIDKSFADDWIVILDTVSDENNALGHLYKYTESDPHPYPSIQAAFNLDLGNGINKIYDLDTIK